MAESTRRTSRLVCRHLERVSGRLLEDHGDLLRGSFRRLKGSRDLQRKIKARIRERHADEIARIFGDGRPARRPAKRKPPTWPPAIPSMPRHSSGASCLGA